QKGFNGLNDKLIQSTIKKAQKLCSKNVEIISSPKLGKIIPEKNFNFKQWLESNDHLDVLNDIDGLIISSLDNYALTSDKTETSGTANYIEGTRLVYNPDYEKAKQNVLYALKMVKEARRELSFSQSMATMSAFTPPSGGLMGAMNALSRTSNTISAGVSRQKVARAETELMTAQTILSNTPYQVEVPNRFTVTYPIYMVQATSRLLCSFKAFDVASRNELGSRMISGLHTASDRYIEGNPRRNIPNDPLVLPNQDEFAVATLFNASDKINTYLKTVMSQHGKRFIHKIEKARKKRDMEKIIENCVYYILSYPDKAAFTPKAVTTLNRLLGKESRLINLEQGLHCWK
ncbi:hypothetical protein KAR28_06675, partial [Candidatus Parcubacteria bacterium]|nr:hypothetical protein [Candidatus Parcubacteria bacterium]